MLTLQVCTSTSLQVCKSASLQVCKSASLQVCKSASLQVCRSAGLQVCKSASLQVCKSAVCKCRTPSPVKHKQTKHNNKFIVISRRYMFPGFRSLQDLNSVAVNKHTKSFGLLNKTVNERTSSEASAIPDHTILKNIS